LADGVSPVKLVATPVRRSTRRSYAALPVGLRDHDTVVDSLHDIAKCSQHVSEDRLLLRGNDALRLEWKTDQDNAHYKSLVHSTD